MNWTQVKDRVSHMCLAGDVVASWSLTQDVAGSSPLMTNIFCVPLQWRIQDFPNGGALFCQKWGGRTSCFQVKSA